MIDIRHLRKEYGDTVALDNLHLQVSEGEVFGLIGPNGAGKTTLIRILTTLLEPTYGEVRIAGVDVLEDRMIRGGSRFLSATGRRQIGSVNAQSVCCIAFQNLASSPAQCRHQQFQMAFVG